MAELSHAEFEALSPSQRNQYMQEQATRPQSTQPYQGDSGFLDALLATNVASLSSPGPRLSLDTDQALEIVSRAHAALDELDKLKDRAQSLTQMGPAATDMASVNYAKQAAMGDGQSGAFGFGSEHVKFEVDYLTKLIEKLRNSFNLTVEQEQEAKKKVEDSANESDGWI